MLPSNVLATGFARDSALIFYCEITSIVKLSRKYCAFPTNPTPPPPYKHTQFKKWSYYWPKGAKCNHVKVLSKYFGGYEMREKKKHTPEL